jgi:hypothetical protein
MGLAPLLGDGVTIRAGFRSFLLIVGVLAVAGWPSLSMPFRGDESLFAVVARGMSDGDVLYRDHWDITNPGIFGFYLVAGSLCGFTEEGIRLFEWCWILAFVLAVSEASRRATGGTRLPLAPALFIGALYYAAGYSATSTLTKTEGLVCFPLFVAVWFAARSTDPRVRPWPWLIGAGAAGGIAILFKMLLATGLGAVWLYLLIAYARGRKRGARSALEYCGGIGIGLLLVLGPVAGYFAAHDSLGELLRTLFVLPPRFLAEGDRAGIERLALSEKWFLGQYAVAVAAALLAIFCRSRAERDPLLPALAILFVASCGIIVAQRLSWWSYHFVLPGGLAGAIAAYGWAGTVRAVSERLNRPLTEREVAALIAVAGVLLLEPLGGAVFQYAKLAGHNMGTTDRGRRSFRLATGGAYSESFAETEWLARADSEPGPICVCGDPLFYWHSGRKPAVRISGWSLEMYPEEIRRAFADELERAKPVYLFVSTGYQPLIRERYPELQAILDAHYIRIRHSAVGDWYRLR